VRFPVFPLHELLPTASDIAWHCLLTVHQRVAVCMSILRKGLPAAKELSESAQVLPTNASQWSSEARVQVRDVF